MILHSIKDKTGILKIAYNLKETKKLHILHYLNQTIF